MALYTVKANQNLFDVALHLYGSVEGLFDLMVTNPGLSMATDLQAGRQLEYHEDFVVNKAVVKDFKSSGVVPANGERSVYSKDKPEDFILSMVSHLPADLGKTSFTISGEGKLVVDWGDNSQLETIRLGSALAKIEHYFDNEVDERKVRAYVPGGFGVDLDTLDVSEFDGTMLFCLPVPVRKFVNRGNNVELMPLQLFQGLEVIDLEGSAIEAPLPIASLKCLREMKLDNTFFPSSESLDSMLEAIASDEGVRPGCVVRLPFAPSPQGMERIDAILGRREWNEPYPWEFYFNGIKYAIEE